jgi:predicted outer membrane repeat protein
MTMSRTNTITFLSILVFVLMASTVEGKIIYVDDDAAGANDGSSWTNAYVYLQDALADANSAEKPVEIRVAQGTYTPLRRFILKNGVAILGGYAGFGAPDPNSRDIEAFKTILSGKIDDVLWNDHVIWSENTDSSTILDGFTIMGGHSTGIPRNGGDCCGGGGIYNKGGSPTILNCTITSNAGSLRGGGMANVDGSSPTLINCTFECNYSLYNGSGIYNENSRLTLINCRFINNVSDNGSGGGIYNDNGTINLSSCTFIKNSAHHDGGGIYNRYSAHLVLKGCSFIGNSTNDMGGGMASEEKRVPIENCIFSGNFAKWRGGAISGGRLTNCTLTGNKALCHSAADGAFLTNCIVWGNFDSEPRECAWSVGAFYSCLQSSYNYADGKGGIFTDPFFVKPGYWADPNDPNVPGDPNDPNAVWIDGDYHLKSQAGRWDPNEGRWTSDDVTSPCIDAGDPNTPVGGEPFPNGGIINMGAYGGTAEASKSYFGEPICETIVAGDINGDCKVDFKDFAIMASHWLQQH